MKLNKLTVLFIINLIVILPLFYLSFYTYPSSDDFSYGMESYKGFEGFIMPDIVFGKRWIVGQYPVAGLIVEGPTMSKPRDGMTESDRKSPFEGAKSALYTKRYGTQQ